MKTNVLPVPATKSTNVRLFPETDLRHATLQVLGLLAPSATARWVAKKFLTPPAPRPISAKSEALLARADDRFTVKLETRFGETSDTAAIPVALWGRGPAIYMVHGWGGRGTQWAAFIDPIVQAGLTAVVLDAPGHGESCARRTSILHFAAALDAVVESVGPARSVMGHSLGAAATALSVRKGLASECVALFGAPADPSEFFDVFLRRIGIPQRLHASIRDEIERHYGFDWRQFAVAAPKRGPGEPGIPALIVHDSSDRDVDFADADRIVDAWPGAEVLTTHGLGHQRILRDPDVVRRVVSWLSNRP